MRISDWSSDVCSSDLAREVADAERPVGQDGRELQRDALAERQRALGADQQVREVVGRTIRSQGIEVVAADPAQDLGEARADLRRLASAEIEQVLEQGGDGIVLIEAGTSIRSEEHTSELQSLLRISYAVFCLK